MSEDTSLIILFCFVFLGLVAFSLLINSVLLRFVKTLGTKNQPGMVVRWSAETKPAIGGLSFFIVFLIGFCVYSIAFDSNQIFKNTQTLGLLLAATLGFLMGLTDDAYNTRPILKFIVQILCGVILVVSGIVINATEMTWFNQLLTVVWVVGIMNSINMLDNMDGITATVAAFIISAALGYLIIHGDFLNVDIVILSATLAAVVGFLFFNWHPSSMYMGDTGSQFLGVILGYVGIKYCWNAESLMNEGSTWFSLAALLILFLLPLIDTSIVTINRLRKGQSPFVGGKDHTTHNLCYLGLSDRKVAIIYALVSVLSVVIYLLLIALGDKNNYYFLGFCISYFFAIFLFLFGITEYNFKHVRQFNSDGETVMNP
jgi:UDP-GlcNAc:undecaprenyl-phosphate GlcNAc-1-phosphate transferase